MLRLLPYHQLYRRELVVAGAGDCRAVLGKQLEPGLGTGLGAVALSTDHKVDLPLEQAQ